MAWPLSATITTAPPSRHWIRLPVNDEAFYNECQTRRKPLNVSAPSLVTADKRTGATVPKVAPYAFSRFLPVFGPSAGMSKRQKRPE
ncbi:unnamed protein product, partial [Fusarium graminearum]